MANAKSDKREAPEQKPRHEEELKKPGRYIVNGTVQDANGVVICEIK